MKYPPVPRPLMWIYRITYRLCLEVLQMGTLATAAVTGLALVTLRIAARALVRT